MLISHKKVTAVCDKTLNLCTKQYYLYIYLQFNLKHLIIDLCIYMGKYVFVVWTFTKRDISNKNVPS